MARRQQAGAGESGCGLLFLIAIIVLIISRCGGGSDSPAPPSPSSVNSGPAPALTPYKYASASSVTCRAQPNRRGRRVGTLVRGQGVQVEEERTGWSRVAASGASCWVSSRYLSDTAPVPPQVSSPNSRPRPLSSDFGGDEVGRQPARREGRFQCGAKRVCRQMNSCAEANYYLNQCGLSRLDGDNDGVPCESICG
jgi:hypothetical protein